MSSKLRNVFELLILILANSKVSLPLTPMLKSVIYAVVTAIPNGIVKSSKAAASLNRLAAVVFVWSTSGDITLRSLRSDVAAH